MVVRYIHTGYPTQPQVMSQLLASRGPNPNLPYPFWAADARGLARVSQPAMFAHYGLLDPSAMADGKWGKVQRKYMYPGLLNGRKSGTRGCSSGLYGGAYSGHYPGGGGSGYPGGRGSYSRPRGCGTYFSRPARTVGRSPYGRRAAMPARPIYSPLHVPRGGSGSIGPYTYGAGYPDTMSHWMYDEEFDDEDDWIDEIFYDSYLDDFLDDVSVVYRDQYGRRLQLPELWDDLV